MWGPFCSVPPVGMMMVILPAAIASRHSTHVQSSRNTVSGACATAGIGQARHANRAVRATANRIQTSYRDGRFYRVYSRRTRKHAHRRQPMEAPRPLSIVSKVQAAVLQRVRGGRCHTVVERVPPAQPAVVFPRVALPDAE